jgi:hypothetical protein
MPSQRPSQDQTTDRSALLDLDQRGSGTELRRLRPATPPRRIRRL